MEVPVRLAWITLWLLAVAIFALLASRTGKWRRP